MSTLQIVVVTPDASRRVLSCSSMAGKEVKYPLRSFNHFISNELSRDVEQCLHVTKNLAVLLLVIARYPSV
jgi:hypothetical protein